MKNLLLFIGIYNGDVYNCTLIDRNKAYRKGHGKEAFERAKENAADVDVKFIYGLLKEKVGSLTPDGIFHVEFDCGRDSDETIDLNSLNFEKTIDEASENDKKYLVILNFDSNIGILFKKKFDKKNALHLKKLNKGNLDDVLDEAYKFAQDVDNEINYQIVVEQEGIPVCFELGIITPDLDLIPKRSEEEEEINESIENDMKFDWYLEYKNKDDIVLYADEREDEIEIDRYPKHKEFEGVSAINRARKLLKDGYEGGISVSKGNGVRKIEGFLRLDDDKKTLMIEIESKGSRSGTLVPLI